MIVNEDLITTREVKGWEGIHLLHFQDSSCSQKVRILLREKGLIWKSHHIDLLKSQNSTSWFLGINPRGLVPVLVHDGKVIVESNDIMEYLDNLPSETPSFFPQDELEKKLVNESLDLENSLHFDLRTFTLGFLVPRAMATKKPDILKDYADNGPPDKQRELEVAFWESYAMDGITKEKVLASYKAYRSAFHALELRLQQNEWLIGQRLSVLDIAWFISIHRLVVCGYPIQKHPRLNQYYQKLMLHPAFSEETAFRGMARLLHPIYGLYRKLKRSTLNDLLK